MEAIWPEARSRVIRSVLGRGADPQTAEDIAQEVALRAIDHDVPFHDLDDFCAWAYRVARNLHVDHARARGRLVDLIEVVNVTDGKDLHGEVEQRLELRRTLRALKTLDQDDRAAIVAGVNETLEPSRKAAVRMAVRRHRARARLLRIVEGIAAFWVLVRAGRRSVQMVPVAAVAACGFLLLPAVVDHLSNPPRDGDTPFSTPFAHGMHRKPTAPQVRIHDRDGTGRDEPRAIEVTTQRPNTPADPSSSDRTVFQVPTPQGPLEFGHEPEPEGNTCAVSEDDQCHVPKLPHPLTVIRDAVPPLLKS